MTSILSRSVSAALVAILLGGATSALAQSDGRSRPACQDQAAPSFGRLVTGTVGDFRRLPSRETVVWLTAGGVAALGAHSADSHTTRTLSGSQPLHEALESGAVVGSTPVQLGAAFTTYVIGRALNRPCGARVGADLVQAQLMAEVLTLAVKAAVRRTRPEGAGFSFPSGHATITFASATVLQQHFGWKVGVPAYAVASYVAASRVQMKRHYFSDVVFGAALGIVAGRTATLANGRLLVAPIATTGGAGASLTWRGCC